MPLVQYQRSLAVLSIAMLFAPITFLAVVVLILLPSSSPTITGDPTLLLGLKAGILIMLLGAYIISQKLIGTKILTIPENDQPLQARQNAHRSGHIVRLALLEGMSLLSAVFLLFTHDHSFTILSIGAALALVNFFPAKMRLELELKLTEKEKSSWNS